MLVLIRGAGDLASGIALRLHHAHMQVVMTDLPHPTAIRRTDRRARRFLRGHSGHSGTRKHRRSG